MATAEASHAHDHDHPEWLAHHFESPEQQFDAGKLGMWLFLAQEVLFFSGLFVAYSVFRANHPEVFTEEALSFLNPLLGALNTIVLLASSLAVAWGVRAAQKNQQSTLLWMHIFTLACAGFFMGVKVVEYGFKFDENLYWAGWANWSNGLHSAEEHLTNTGIHTHFMSITGVCIAIGLLAYLGGLSLYRSGDKSLLGRLLVIASGFIVCVLGGYVVAAILNAYPGVATNVTAVVSAFILMGVLHLFVKIIGTTSKVWGAVCMGLGLTVLGMAGGVVVASGIQQSEVDSHAAHAADAAHAEGAHEENHAEHGAAAEPAGHEPAEATAEVAAAAATPTSEDTAASHVLGGRGANEGNFFSIYFAMTGVHALHILAGIAAISWIVGRIARGDFGPERYGPVEYVGLYWHLVDLVWIYLFPLLYLVH
ncbi:MAG: cytochrome c oxidase subunit 3 [Planctomycetales bacterium]|nr:cytochrome c oxidase subunit 3 [Planctomycetales bacterium]